MKIVLNGQTLTRSEVLVKFGCSDLNEAEELMNAFVQQKKATWADERSADEKLRDEVMEKQKLHNAVETNKHRDERYAEKKENERTAHEDKFPKSITLSFREAQAAIDFSKWLKSHGILSFGQDSDDICYYIILYPNSLSYTQKNAVEKHYKLVESSRNVTKKMDTTIKTAANTTSAVINNGVAPITKSTLGAIGILSRSILGLGMTIASSAINETKRTKDNLSEFVNNDESALEARDNLNSIKNTVKSKLNMSGLNDGISYGD